MPKRFIDTELLLNPWVRSLPPDEKLLWVAIFTRCDNAGVWNVDWDMMKLLVSPSLDPQKVLARFSGRFMELDGGLRWFIPGFIEFQYPKGLQEKNPAHFNVFKTLRKYSIDPLKPLGRPFEGTKDMVMGMEEGKVMEEAKETPAKNTPISSQENAPTRQVPNNTLHPTVETPPVFSPALIAQWASTQVEIGGKMVGIPDPTMIACPAKWVDNPPALSLWFEEVHRLFQAVNPADIKDFYAFPRGSIAIWEAAYCKIGPQTMLHRAAWYLAFCGASGKQPHSLGGWLKDGGHKHDWQAKFHALPNVGKVLKEREEQARLTAAMTKKELDY